MLHGDSVGKGLERKALRICSALAREEGGNHSASPEAKQASCIQPLGVNLDDVIRDRVCSPFECGECGPCELLDVDEGELLDEDEGEGGVEFWEQERVLHV